MAPVHPHLEEWPASATPVGAILSLHGGRVRGRRPVGRLDLPVLRMRCLARGVHERVAPHGVAVWNLRFTLQGWNGDDASPVDDARWALQQLAERGAGPIVLLGHSMGGRTALRVADEPNVVGVIALAPWLPHGEPMADLRGRRLLIAHGTADHTTDPRLSRRYSDEVGLNGGDVQHLDVSGDGHALLRKPSTWNRIAADTAMDMLGVSDLEGCER